MALRPTNSAVATQLRAFSGELNGISFLHGGRESAGELSVIARAADEIASRIVTASDTISTDTTSSAMHLAARVRTLADANRDATYAARLSVAAGVLSAFIEQATERESARPLRSSSS